MMKALLFLTLCSVILASCTDDEDPIMMNFVPGSGYVSSNTTLPPGSDIIVAIEVESLEDAVNTYKVVESVNGAAGVTVVDETGINANIYGYEYWDTIDSTSGTTHKFTCTITTAKGVSKSLDVTVTVQ